MIFDVVKWRACEVGMILLKSCLA